MTRPRHSSDRNWRAWMSDTTNHASVRGGFGSDRALRLAALQQASDRFGYARRTALQGAADIRLELESVSVFEEHAEHRRGVEIVEVVRGQEVAQPVVDSPMFDGQVAQVLEM